MLLRAVLLITALSLAALGSVSGESFLKFHILAPELYQSLTSMSGLLLSMSAVLIAFTLAWSIRAQARVALIFSGLALGLVGALGFMPSALGLSTMSAFDYPEHVDLSEVDINPEDWVVGFTVGDESVAYLADALEAHLVVNDNLNGELYVIAYCNSCNSPLAYRAVVDAEETAFDIVGTYIIDVVLQDRAKGAWWDAGTGERLAGRGEDHQLEQLPLTMAKWGQWLEIAPNTMFAQLPAESAEQN